MQVRPSFEWVGMYFVVARSMQNIKLTQALNYVTHGHCFTASLYNFPYKKSNEKRLAVVVASNASIHIRK